MPGAVVVAERVDLLGEDLDPARWRRQGKALRIRAERFEAAGKRSGQRGQFNAGAAPELLEARQGGIVTEPVPRLLVKVSDPFELGARLRELLLVAEPGGQS